MLLGGSHIFVPSGFAQLDAAIDPTLIPKPRALNVDTVAFSWILRIFCFPHFYVLLEDPKLLEPSLLYFRHYVLGPELRLLNFLLNLILLIDCLGEVGLRINELDNLVCLPRAVYKLSLE